MKSKALESILNSRDELFFYYFYQLFVDRGKVTELIQQFSR